MSYNEATFWKGPIVGFTNDVRSVDRPSVMAPRVTALITSYNRRETTLVCLRSLCSSSQNVALRIVLVDDCSSDGTEAAVREEFPDVTIISGSGKLYWAGGMRSAFERASEEPFDYLLWLNDDVCLANEALGDLIMTERRLRPIRGPAIVVGALQDPLTGLTSYSGVHRPRFKRTQFERIPPGTTPRHAETLNGNVVLVPHDVAQRLGNLDPAFRHGIADFDYGLRAAAAGIETWIAPGHVGMCARNAPDVADAKGYGLTEMLSVKRLPPWGWLVFTQRHTGRLWPLYWFSPYAGAALRSSKQAYERWRQGHTVESYRPHSHDQSAVNSGDR